MKLIGKTPINPFFFFTGKIAGYFLWIVLILGYFGTNIFQKQLDVDLKIFALVVFFIAFFVFITSMFFLGKSTSLGVPSEKTKLKREGLYRFSRNPIYVAFNVMSFSAVLFTMNLIVLVLAIYSIVVYHYIILGEERFLQKRFGKGYADYCRKVRRYI